MPDDAPAGRRHSSDLTDTEWSALEPSLARRSHFGRLLEWSRRLMADAVFYLLRTGRQWRMPPRCFPPWPTVFSQFRRWRMDGTITAAHDRLRRRVREAEGRGPEPPAAILDSRSVRTTGVGGPARGYDGGKKVKCRKRHLLVDASGLVLLAHEDCSLWAPRLSSTTTAAPYRSSASRSMRSSTVCLCCPFQSGLNRPRRVP